MTDQPGPTRIIDGLTPLVSSGDYEAVRAGLAKIIDLLEQPGLGLNDSVRAYEVGRQLAMQCQQLLDAAELRITELDGAAESYAGGPLNRVQPDS